MLPQTLTIDDVLVCVTYCAIDDERALDLELRYSDGSLAVGAYRASTGLVLAAGALATSARAELISQCASVLAIWNAQ
jgi:hypothetical protein